MQTYYSKDEARIEITRLVDQFLANEAALQDAPEAMIENNYLRPLFRCLNWNVDNEGLSEPQWEFVLQKTDRKGKRPDYRLQLDGQWLLFIDAKKVKYSMHDPLWINQVYAYAYSTQNNPAPRKVDFAVLTDFQEFVTLDCTLYAARPEAVNNFRVFDWKSSDYVEKFDTLWDVFERNNMLVASRERNSGLWARYLSPKTVKANRTPSDKAFLAELDDEKTGWRVRLAKDMKRLDPQLSGELITAAVQLLIDRLIFVKVLSDREIEDDYLAQLAERIERAGLNEQAGTWFTACRDIFDKLNGFYNGSVFEPRPELEAVRVSNKVVREVIRHLQPEYSPYNFAVMPVEILGTIYERFLGRVVTTTAQRVRIEYKPEYRKARGVYYTPQYIVNYIVQNTVGILLADCHTPADVARLKILDPACGSGSFLLGAYDALIEWHKHYYGDKEHLSKKDREAAYYGEGGRIRLTAKLKRQILLSNIYGVDIDEQAGEVTRLSLSLKALEDTRHDELDDERTLFHQTVLPDLSNNIKCGNSLISKDYFAGQLLTDLNELKRVKPFDWEQEFQDVMKIGGFNAVIGNPPYIDSEWLTRTNPSLRAYCTEHYLSAKGNWDIFCVFVEKALRLCNDSGMSSMIVPNKLFSAGYARALRGLLTQKYSLVTVRDYSSVSVFPVSVYPIVYVAATKPMESERVLVERMRANDDVPEVEKKIEIELEALRKLGDAAWSNTLSGSASDLMEKISKDTKPLGEVANVSGAATVSEAYEIREILSEYKPNMKELFTVVNTGTIDRYVLLWGFHPMRYIKRTFKRPVLARSQWGKISEKRKHEAHSPKIIIGGMNRELECAYDNGGTMAGKSTSIILSEKMDLRYLLGILNSRLMTYFAVAE